MFYLCISMYLKTHLTSKLYEMVSADFPCSTSLTWNGTPTLDVATNELP